MTSLSFLCFVGSDVIPDTVHHVVCRVDPSKQPRWMSTSFPAITDEVHEGGSARTTHAEVASQLLKERKQQLLVHLVDHFEVDGRRWLVVMVVAVSI